MAEFFSAMANALSSFMNLGWFATLLIWTLTICGGVFITKGIIKGVRSLRTKKK